MKEIQLRDAKATFSAVVDQAVHGTPSVITRRGRREAVILSYEEYEKLSHIPSFGKLLAAYPGEEDVATERNDSPGRTVDL